MHLRHHEGLERLLNDSQLLGGRNIRPETQQPLAYDGAGRLYAYGKDHVLRSVSVREQLLEDAPPQGREVLNDSSSGSLLWSRKVQPAHPCTAQQLLINRAGTFALVYGHADQEDGLPALHIISLTDDEDGECSAIVVDDPQLVQRPGLQILQAEWHPSSDMHFAVLASDNTFRLYHLDNVSAPEQQVELRLRERQPLGLLDMEGSQAVSFAFGSFHLWERFAVYFTCSDGQVFVLVPLAPFGTAVPASALHRLHGQCDAMTYPQARACTRAWLQQSFPGLSRAGKNGTLDSVTCQPAALDEHVPALAGPLPISAAGGEQRTSLLEFLRDEDDIVITAVSLGSSVGALAVGTQRGGIGLLVMADVVQPAWAVQPPQCALRGEVIMRTRMQCAQHADAAPRLLLMDVVELGEQSDAQPAHARPPDAAVLRLLPVPSDSEQLYAVQPNACCLRASYFLLCLRAGDLFQGCVAWKIIPCVVAVKLPWLSRIAALVGGVSSTHDSAAALPVTALAEVCSTSLPIAGTALIGDLLLGTALVVAEGSGRTQCLASPSDSAGQLLRQAVADATPIDRSASEPDSATVSERYGQLLAGPAAVELPAATGSPLSGSPKGQRLLNDSIAALRKGHVEFAHSAYHELLQHLERLQQNSTDQAAQLCRLQLQEQQLQDNRRRLDEQLNRASTLHEQLRGRFKKLAEQHARLPQPMSSAEKCFSSQELPALERIATELRRKCQHAGSRWDALAAPMGKAQPPAGAAAMPPGQVRKLRGALSEQASILALSRAKVEAAAAALAEDF